MSSVIITGAGGWLGRSLVSELGRGNGTSLRCLVRSPDQAAEVRALANGAAVEVVAGDVRDPTVLAQLFDGTRDATVFHAAAVIHPARRTREFFDVNVGGTALVLDQARRSQCRRVVHISSNSPFGTNPTPEHTFDEDADYNPAVAYGWSKMEAERLVFRAADRDELDAVIVRCPWFYGPFQPARQTRFFAAVRRGRFPLVGDGSNRRSLVYTDNLVQGVALAATGGANGRAYWIADPRPYPMREILDAVRRALRAEGLGVADRQPRLPAIVSDVAERADQLLQARGRYVQPVHVLSEMARTIACTTARAEAELGYRPAVELEEGMRRSVRWCLDAGEAL